MLLEAAFSHYGFSSNNGHGTAGFFRDVHRAASRQGPVRLDLLRRRTPSSARRTRSCRASPATTRREIGDERDEFGGIGRNGPLKTSEVATVKLNSAGTPYHFKDRVINNLDGSGGLIKDHSDVTNEAVTYAFASAIART